MRKPVLIRQTAENECGFCCIAMVASFYKYYITIPELRKKINIGRDGLEFIEIVKILQSMNLTSKAMKVNNFSDFNFDNGPFIVHYKNNHYVTVIGRKKEKIEIYDPSSGKEIVTKEFLINRASGIVLQVISAANFKKSGKKKSEYKYLFNIIKSVRSSLIFVIFISIISYLFSVIIPVYMQIIIDNIINKTNVNLLNTLILIGILIFSSILISLYRSKKTIDLQENLYRNISFKNILHLLKINYSFFDNHNQGDILFRINLLTQFQQLVSNNVVQAIIDITSIIVIFSYLFYSYANFTFFIFMILLIISIFSLVISLQLVELKRKEYEGKKNVDSLVVEIVSNMTQIRMLHLTGFFIKNYIEYFESYIKQFKKTETKNQYYNIYINTLFSYFPIIILIVLFITNNELLSIGKFFSFFSLTTTLFRQFLSLITQLTTLSVTGASIHLINDLIDEKEDHNKGTKYENKFKSLSINNVSFKYSDKSKYALKNVNLAINKGEIIAIVGKSGSGKTTLNKLISNLYKNYYGNIMFNDNIIYDINENCFSKLVCFVPQLPVYFNKTIRENITLGDDTVSDEMIYDALKTVNFYEEVLSMPMNLETIISGQGGNLSGGQIQKLSLARSLIREPELLILDEATSSLDPWNENLIYQNLSKKNISLIIVSHRLSTVKIASRIYVFNQGEIVESGQHDDLISNESYYYTLFKDQFDDSINRRTLD